MQRMPIFDKRAKRSLSLDNPKNVTRSNFRSKETKIYREKSDKYSTEINYIPIKFQRYSSKINIIPQ